MSRRAVAIAVGIAVVIAIVALASRTPPQPTSPQSALVAPPPATNPHVSGAPCASCHAEEAARWSASHHALATTTTIDHSRFDGKERKAGTLHATPLLEGGRAMFRVRDLAGTTTLPVLGVIGVDPLQQYLLDADRGRQLVAPIAWDVAQGRWFDPSPVGAIGDPADPLYWAGIAGNWNHLCGECHATAYEKRYDPETDAYAPVSTHPAVNCEACHGAGDPAPLDTQTTQIQACAPCHSRRETLAYGATPQDALLDHFRPALIGSEVFLADGRNAAPDEPFEWGAFAQSRKHAVGLRCSDCHDPHSGELRAEGDATCLACHPAMGADPATHPATDCISCHMPTSTYMGIHQRHDHGIRIPGSPGRSAVFQPALDGDASSVPGLLILANDPTASTFDRASALALMRRFPPPFAPTFLEPLARHEDPLLRVEAVATLGAWGELDAVSRALTDPIRAVRFAAFMAITTVGPEAVARAPAYSTVRTEYLAATLEDADLGSAWQNIALVKFVAGDIPGATVAFENVLKREPGNEPARRALEMLAPLPSPP